LNKSVVRASNNLPLAVLLLGLIALLVVFLQEPAGDENSGPSTTDTSASTLEDGAAASGLSAEQGGSSITREPGEIGEADPPDELASITAVKVVDVDGRGIVGARVLPWLGETLHPELLTDQRGEVSLSGMKGTGGLVVIAPNAMPLIESQHFEGLPIVVYVDPGTNLAGHVTFKRPRDGFFRIPMSVLNSSNHQEWCEDPELAFAGAHSVKVEVGSTDDYAGVEIDMDLTNRVNPWDLGNILVKDLAHLPIRVVDAAGVPITGAFAFGKKLSAPTDSDGFTDVPLADGVEYIEVGAVGYQSVDLSALQAFTERVTITLEHAVRLQVSWQVPTGYDMSEVLFRIQSEGPTFHQLASKLDSAGLTIRRAGGLRYIGGNTVGATGMTNADFRLDPEQRDFHIWGLSAGVSMRAMLVDRMRNPIASSPPMIFFDGEERAVELEISALPGPLVGKVVDSSGAPVSGAQVMVRGNSRGASETTAPDGTFGFGSLSGPTIWLTVEREGYATWEEGKFVLPPPGQPIEIMLEHERVMTIFFRDSAGTTYQDGFIDSPGEVLEGATSKDGGFVLHALPQGSFKIYWTIGGADGEEWVPEGVDEYVLEVPAMGSVVIHASRETADEVDFVNVRFIPVDHSGDVDVDSTYKRGIRFEHDVLEVDKVYGALLPGKYRVEFSLRNFSDNQWGEVPLQVIESVDVSAGKELELELSF